MSEATAVQPTPRGSGRDIARLLAEELPTTWILPAVKGYETVELWVRSALVFMKAGQLGLAPDHAIIINQLLKRIAEDVEERSKLGEERYGERLRAFNGRDPKVDAYQELLDAAQYLRQRREEAKAEVIAAPYVPKPETAL